MPVHSRSGAINQVSICLIRPPAVESFRFATTSITPPLGIAYLAAAIEASGRSVTVVDAVGEGAKVRAAYYKGYLVGLRPEDLVQRIPPDATLVGISVIFTHEWPCVVQLIDKIKQVRPELPIVIGGEHVTAMSEFCLLTSKADYLVQGEGEETVIELLEALEGGRSPVSIDGIAYRSKDAIVVEPRRDRRDDIDDIHTPAWDHIDLETYFRNRFVGGMHTNSLTIPILATRGCPYQCTYCSAPNMWLPRWIPRDPIAVADEIESYVVRYGASNFPFQDLTAIVRKDWVKAFCQELIDRDLGITWQLPTGTRSEAIDDEVADLLKRSGMVSMAYAPESGSDTTRKFIKKKMKKDNLFESIVSAAKANLNVAAFIVIGFPHDKPDHLRENLEFIDRLVEAGVTDLSVGFYMALPGTELFHSIFDAGNMRFDRAYMRHILDSLALWPSQSYCKQLSRLDLCCWKLRFYVRFYGAKKKLGSKSDVGTSLMRMVRGLVSSTEHDSKLQTALRNGVTSFWETLIAQFGPRWMSKADERELFADWDQIYREARKRKFELGVALPAPADTAELHRANVTPALVADHGVRKEFPVHI